MQSPIVADGYGKLYNKEKVLQYLLEMKKSKDNNKEKEEGKNGGIKEERGNTIKSLNDVQQLQISLDTSKGILECPVSNIIIDLQKDTDVKLSDAQFSYIVPCGCSMNTKMLYELIGLKSLDVISEETNKACPHCNATFDARNIIPISAYLGDSRIKNRLQERLERLQGENLFHNLKPRKTRAKRKSTSSNTEEKETKRKKC